MNNTFFGIEPTEYDWPEDFEYENGMYEHTCLYCGRTFIGYKRRVECKVCCNELTSIVKKYQE